MVVDLHRWKEGGGWRPDPRSLSGLSILGLPGVLAASILQLAAIYIGLWLLTGSMCFVDYLFLD
jgi:hypothetical protein